MSFTQILIVAIVAGGMFGGSFAVVQKVVSVIKAESNVRTAYTELNYKHQVLLERWNAIIEKINKKGGAAFLEGQNRKELITRKLLEMRKC